MSLAKCPSGHVYNPTRYATCPYCKPTRREEEEKEKLEEMEAANFSLGENQRVNGWLVCIKGSCSGTDYKIRAGKNFIGRGEDMDIRILGDNAISKTSHAILVYDTKLDKAMLLPGDSEGLVYLGKEAVYVPVELQSYDKIEIGNSVFLYVALCGEQFAWDRENSK